MTGNVSRSQQNNHEYFFIHVKNLPRKVTWQKVKDSLRPPIKSDFWVNVEDSGQGTDAMIKVQRRDEANKAYEKLTQMEFPKRDGLSFRVHVRFWDPTSRAVQPNNWISQHLLNFEETNGRLANTSGYLAVQPAMMQTHQAAYAQPVQSVPPYVQGQVSAPTYNMPMHPPVPYVNMGVMGPVQSQTYPQLAQRIAPPSRSVPSYQMTSGGTPINTTNGIVVTRTSSVFFGKMDFNTTERDIRALFRPFGHIERVHLNGVSGRSKGTGTVLFSKPQAAQSAINNLHGKPFMGASSIIVRWDKGGSSTAGSSAPTIVDSSRLRRR